MEIERLFICDSCKQKFTTNKDNYSIGHISYKYFLKDNKGNYAADEQRNVDLCPQCTDRLLKLLNHSKEP